MAMSANIINNNLPVLNPNTTTTEGSGPIYIQTRVLRPNQNIPMEYPIMALRSANQPPSIFRQTNQTGFLSILYAIGQRPLELWEKQIRSGYVKRITDADIRSLAIEILAPNIGTTFITTPLSPVQSLGIHLPIIVFVVKNLRRYFSYEIQIRDGARTRRRFLISNYNSSAKVRPFSVSIPLTLEDGWNQVSLNLATMTQKVFGTEYKETIRVQIHANCRIRRVYFCDRVYAEDEIPADFKLYVMNTAAQKEREDTLDKSTPNKATELNAIENVASNTGSK